MDEDFAHIHPLNLADFANHLASIGVALVYDQDEHLREWKARQPTSPSAKEVTSR